MPSLTNEQALESAIEKQLTGSTLEMLKGKGITLENLSDSPELYRSGHGYFIGSPYDFNARHAIDERRFWNFLETTQKEELAKLQKKKRLETKDY